MLKNSLPLSHTRLDLCIVHCAGTVGCATSDSGFNLEVDGSDTSFVTCKYPFRVCRYSLTFCCLSETCQYPNSSYFFLQIRQVSEFVCILCQLLTVSETVGQRKSLSYRPAFPSKSPPKTLIRGGSRTPRNPPFCRICFFLFNDVFSTPSIDYHTTSLHINL